MEEPAYEYDGRQPITVPNPKNKSPIPPNISVNTSMPPSILQLNTNEPIPIGRNDAPMAIKTMATIIRALSPIFAFLSILSYP